MKLEFKHPIDTKSFVIGILASMTGVVIWDIIKYNRNILQPRNESKRTNNR